MAVDELSEAYLLRWQRGRPAEGEREREERASAPPVLKNTRTRTRTTRTRTTRTRTHRVGERYVADRGKERRGGSTYPCWAAGAAGEQRRRWAWRGGR
jgi:hypothetical protein